MTTAKNLEQALRNLKRQHKTDWSAFNSKMDGVLTVLGNRMSAEGTKELGRPVAVTWNTTEDITENVSAEDFVAAGFSQDEAEAMIFVLTEDCMGQAVNSLEMVERYFCYCLK